ncbi:MAG: hypothetical protein KDD70_06900 [Bdellovibrionales bacterium]|nr:hypothetical protein [Bdellovibrionales bacterium]
MKTKLTTTQFGIVLLTMLSIISNLAAAQQQGETEEFPDRGSYWKDINSTFQENGQTVSCLDCDGREQVQYFDPSTPCTVAFWDAGPESFQRTTDCICGKLYIVWTNVAGSIGYDANGDLCAKMKETSATFLDTGVACTGSSQTPMGKIREKRLCGPKSDRSADSAISVQPDHSVEPGKMPYDFDQLFD